jgi:hypothetical protein
MDVKTVIDKRFFFEFALELAQKSLMAASTFDLEKLNLVDERWMESIELVIPELQTRIKAIV